MKRLLIIVAAIVAGTICGAPISSAAASDQEACLAKLVGALWSDINVSLYTRTAAIPPTEEEIRKTLNAAFRAMDSESSKAVTDADREAQIAAEVQRIMREAKEPKLTKSREFISGLNQRIDRSEVASVKEEKSWDETLVNVADGAGRITLSYRLDHNARMGQLMTGAWRREHLLDLGTFSEGSRFLLRALLGEEKKSDSGASAIVPSRARIEACLSGAADSVRLLFDEGASVGGRRTVRVTCYLPKGTNPFARWTADQEDFNMVFREEMLDSASGKTTVLRESSDFMPAAGSNPWYPRQSSITEYSPDAEKVTRKTEYAVIDVSFGAESLPAQAFDFQAPSDYAIIDYRYGKPIVLQPANGPSYSGMQGGEATEAPQPVPVKMVNGNGEPESVALPQQESGARPVSSTGKTPGSRQVLLPLYSVAPLLLFLIVVGVEVLGRKNWFARRARGNPYFMFRKWDWTNMPRNWGWHLAGIAAVAITFLALTVSFCLRPAPPGPFSGIVIVALLMTTYFVALGVRIIAKRMQLGRRREEPPPTGVK